MKEEEDFALAGLVLIVDSRTNIMFAGAACTGRFVVERVQCFGLQYLFNREVL